MSENDKNMTIEGIKREAVEEINAEIRKEYSGKIKAKLLQLKTAEKVVANIKRELEDLEIRIQEELS
jgi:hypothetical protein